MGNMARTEQTARAQTDSAEVGRTTFTWYLVRFIKTRGGVQASRFFLTSWICPCNFSYSLRNHLFSLTLLLPSSLLAFCPCPSFRALSHPSSWLSRRSISTIFRKKRGDYSQSGNSLLSCARIHLCSLMRTRNSVRLFPEVEVDILGHSSTVTLKGILTLAYTKPIN